MADTKGNIEEHEVTAVVTTTTSTPHEADESSAPGPYEGLKVNRPPVSTNRPDVPIAQSLVAGAGAPSPDVDETPPEEYIAPNAYVTAADKENVEKVQTGPTKDNK